MDTSEDPHVRVMDGRLSREGGGSKISGGDFGGVPTINIMPSLPLDGKLDGKQMTIEICIGGNRCQVLKPNRGSWNFCRW